METLSIEALGIGKSKQAKSTKDKGNLEKEKYVHSMFKRYIDIIIRELTFTKTFIVDCSDSTE